MSAERSRKPAGSEVEVEVEVVCRDLPGSRFDDTARPAGERYHGVRLGIQRGRDGEEWTALDREPVRFHPRFRVKELPGGKTRFLGPYAQGPADDRFFYLVWAAPGKDGELAMFRRLKVRLGHLRWDQIAAAADGKRQLAVHLRLTAEDGCPLCATPPASHIEWRI